MLYFELVFYKKITHRVIQKVNSIFLSQFLVEFNIILVD